MHSKLIRQPSLPFLSEAVLFIMNVIVTTIHFLLPSYSQLISTGMIGGLFGLMVPPAIIVYIIIRLLDYLIPHLNGYASYYIGLPLLLLYIIQILILDNSHLKPLPVGVFRSSTTFLHKMTLEFWLTHFNYFPVTIATQPTVELPPTKQYVLAVHPHGIHCWPLNVLVFIGSPFDKRFPGLVGGHL